jgi:hypothetical protein
VAYFFGRPTYEGSFFGWFALFSGVAVILTVISMVTLIVGEGIDFFRNRLELETRNGRIPPQRLR